MSKSGRGIRHLVIAAAVAAAGVVPVVTTAANVGASGSPGVVISQVYGGGGNSGAPYTHDFVELFNRSTSPVSLTGWSVQYASATGTGNFASNPVAALSGTLAPGQYYLVQLAGGVNGVALPTPDLVGTVNMAAGSGKVALVGSTTGLACNGGSTLCSPEQLAQIVDLVGYGSANFFEGAGAAGTLSNTTAALRKAAGCTDTDNNAADFDTGAPAPRNTASPTRPCQFTDQAPGVESTSPADGDVDVSPSATVSVTFTEPVAVSGDWFSIECTTTGEVDATVSGGPVIFTLTPTTAFAEAEQCTVTVTASNVTDLDTDDPPDAMAADVSWTFTIAASDPCTLPYTPIYTIQGSGMATPLAGQVVTTFGVVVGDYEGPAPALRGFYLQDPEGDGDPETSDGIFVFNGSNNDVELGDLVRVTGTAAEFQNQTQLSNASNLVSCGTGASVAPVDVTLPFASAEYLERYEGMLVRLHQTLTVTEHFQLGRFGQVVMSSGGRLAQPTNVTTPGADALALQAANNLNRIIVDDALNNQNPDPILFGRGGNPLSATNTLRGGDTATGIVGVMTYTWAGNAASGNAYRVRPVNALGGGVPEFEAVNERPDAPDDVGGTLKVGALNVLNYFNTFSGCTNGVGGAATNCRGADNLVEFDRQWPKTVAAIVGMDVDVLALIEIENDGYGPDSAIAHLTDRLDEATAPGTWAFIDADAGTGMVNSLGTDAIKVGFLYRPAAVTPVGATAALNTEAFVNGGDPAPRNRPALAQAFMQNSNGEVFVAVSNHLKSKGSACSVPDAGDGQGNCNAVRTTSAQLLAEWLDTDPTGSGDPDVMILGDLNAYAKEDPIAALEAAGYTDLIAEFSGPAAYSYVFDGQWGYLDHALGTSSMTSQVTGVTEWHVNADEPNVLDYNTNFKSAGQITSLYAPDQFRNSDHDPVIVGLDLEFAPAPIDEFLTGGGTISLPGGARASFGLVGRYVPSSATPVGHVTYSIPGLKVQSTSLDWLTVTGNTADLAGVATVNGVEGYRLRVTATDAAPDMLRVQVRSGSGMLVYDSGTQQVRGQLTIHR
jgi:uncharacterized protein